MATYYDALSRSGFVTPTPYATGIPVWQDSGIEASHRLIRLLASLVGERYAVRVVAHPRLCSAEWYRSFFPTFKNMYAVRDGGGDRIVLPDSLYANVLELERLRFSPHTAVVSVNAIARWAKGDLSPLLRDRIMWPAVQLNHILPDRQVDDALEFYREVFAMVLARVGLAALTVENPRYREDDPRHRHYARRGLQTVGALPDGALIILSSLFVIGRWLERRFPGAGPAIDLGFTARVLAAAAAQHHDRLGYMPTSVIAPVQVGVVADHAAGMRVERWVEELGAAQLRVRLEVTASTDASMREAGKRLLRKGCPVVVSVGGAREIPVRVVRRRSLERIERSSLPSPGEVFRYLCEHDESTLAASQRLLTRVTDANASLPHLCNSCHDDRVVQALGVITPIRVGPCTGCGTTAPQRLFLTAA